MPINTKALEAAVCKKYGTAKDFAEQIQWDRIKISRLLNGSYLPDVDECAALAECLALTQSEFCEIFLPGFSQNRETRAEKKQKNNFSPHRSGALLPNAQLQALFEGGVCRLRFSFPPGGENPWENFEQNS